MYSNSQWYAYIQQIYHQQLIQAGKIEQLEKAIHQIKEDTMDLKQQKQFNIEKIEYHFDQLKIEQLEGTLNIGITPGHAEDIEKYAVNKKEMEDLQFSQSPSSSPQQQSSMEPELSESDLYQRIYTQVNQYLQEDATEMMNSLRNKYQFELDHEYDQMMIVDLKKQLDQRIRYYLHQINSRLETDDLEKRIVEQTKSDIYWAMDQHYQKIKQQGE